MLLGKRESGHAVASECDPLTGLADRARFLHLLERPASWFATATVRAVVVLDIDDFRLVNDTLGLPVGDRLLQAVADRLAIHAPVESVVARLCADEFAVLIEDVAEPHSAARAAEQLLRALSEWPFTVGPHSLNISASAGVATGVGATPLRQADLALRIAKQSGKGRLVTYDPSLGTEVADRLPLRAELDRALARGELRVCYQPIVRLDGERVVGFEALLRWQHPERGELSPQHFISAAEESGLIVPIGAWVMAQAIRAAAGWRRSSTSRVSVSVNVSARQLAISGFVDTVLRELTRNGLPPDHLVLELTESLLLQDDSRAWDGLACLRGRGVRIAVDDFGTGYSSLPYLRTRLIDIIKIDKSFVRNVDTSPEQRAFVEAIIRLAAALQIDVVAEGVEGRDEGRALNGLGCQFAQGYHYGRPTSDMSVVEGLVRPRPEGSVTGPAPVRRGTRARLAAIRAAA